MKTLFLPLVLMSLGAWAQTTPQSSGISFTDDYIIVDMNTACYSKNLYANCDLSNQGVNLVMTGTGSTGTYSGSLAGIYTRTKLTSTIPIAKVEIKCSYYNYCGTFTGNTLSGEAEGPTTVSFDNPGYNEVTFASSYASYPAKVYLSTGIPSFLKENFTSAGNVLRSTYIGVLRNSNGFKTEIAKSHRGHLDRFNQALTDGIALLDAKDKDGKKTYSVLDWRVQENARLIVVFGSVLNELLTDYDDVQRLQTSIRSMRVLVDQLRSSYGWERGLAGTVSKASSSLIEVVRLELQELASIKMAMGAPDLQIYMDLLRETRTLQAQIDASRSGDMKAQREIDEMLATWNGKTWQDEMARLMNAGPDFKNLVLPKLSMLLYAMASISDLSDQNFIVPDRSLLH